MHNFRVALSVITALGLGGMLSGVVGAQDDATSPKPHPRAAARAVAWGAPTAEELAKLSPEERAKRRLVQIWWNRPAVIKLVGLEEAQRKKMDETYVLRMAAVGELAAPAHETNEALATALAKGDWAGARVLRARASDADVKLRAQELETVIAMLELLTEEQRTKLGAERPFILRGAWARSVPPGGMMRRAGQPAPPKGAP